MNEAFLILFSLLLVCVFLMVILFKKSKNQNAVARYVCDTCGELDCICHRVDDNSNK
jgi:hypothetical protein